VIRQAGFDRSRQMTRRWSLLALSYGADPPPRGRERIPCKSSLLVLSIDLHKIILPVFLIISGNDQPSRTCPTVLLSLENQAAFFRDSTSSFKKLARFIKDARVGINEIVPLSSQFAKKTCRLAERNVRLGP
jgi:hypothetical protein